MFTRLLAFLCFVTITAASFGQSNIVHNGSFETNFTEGWFGTNIGGVVNNNYPGVDGRSWIDFGYPSGVIWQDLNTVAGRKYAIKFYMGGYPSSVLVKFGNSYSNLITSPSDGWVYTNCIATASGTVTRLQFESSNGSSMDGINVGWTEEPPSIVKPLVSYSAFEGAKIVMSVKFSGAPPVSFQWFKKNQALAGQTNAALSFTNVDSSDSGNYSVVVSNEFGFEKSNEATLLINPIPNVPIISAQPKSQNIVAGYGMNLLVNAVGKAPLAYQWKFNGNDVPGATTNILIFDAMALTNAGEYSVIVSNHFGSVLSLPATVTVTNMQGGGFLSFRSHYPALNPAAPVYDVDGVTLLTGTNYVAQLYTSSSSNSLHALGTPAAFLIPGYFISTNSALLVPDVTVNDFVYAQVRVWDMREGKTFEQAQAQGGKYGKSDLLYLKAGGFGIPVGAPAPLTGLRPFALQTGSPLHASAKLEPAGKSEDGMRQWRVIGESSAKYLIEKRIDNGGTADWAPLTIVTNATGVVVFTDPNANNSSAHFYRARILEQ